MIIIENRYGPEWFCLNIDYNDKDETLDGLNSADYDEHLRAVKDISLFAGVGLTPQEALDNLNLVIERLNHG